MKNRVKQWVKYMVDTIYPSQAWACMPCTRIGHKQMKVHWHALVQTSHSYKQTCTNADKKFMYEQAYKCKHEQLSLHIMHKNTLLPAHVCIYMSRGHKHTHGTHSHTRTGGMLHQCVASIYTRKRSLSHIHASTGMPQECYACALSTLAQTQVGHAHTHEQQARLERTHAQKGTHARQTHAAYITVHTQQQYAARKVQTNCGERDPEKAQGKKKQVGEKPKRKVTQRRKKINRK